MASSKTPYARGGVVTPALQRVFCTVLCVMVSGNSYNRASSPAPGAQENATESLTMRIHSQLIPIALLLGALANSQAAPVEVRIGSASPSSGPSAHLVLLCHKAELCAYTVELSITTGDGNDEFG
jgi:hypothetical protein